MSSPAADPGPRCSAHGSRYRESHPWTRIGLVGEESADSRGQSAKASCVCQLFRREPGCDAHDCPHDRGLTSREGSPTCTESSGMPRSRRHSVVHHSEPRQAERGWVLVRRRREAERLRRAAVASPGDGARSGDGPSVDRGATAKRRFSGSCTSRRTVRATVPEISTVGDEAHFGIAYPSGCVRLRV
jgi:hypothetical protein